MSEKPEPDTAVASSAESIVTDAMAALRADDRLGAIEILAGAVCQGSPRRADKRVEALCNYLEHEPDTAKVLGETLTALIHDHQVGPALIESSGVSSSGFLSELVSRLSQRFLPELRDDDDIRSAIQRVFPGRSDHLSIEHVSDDTWMRLLGILGITSKMAPALEKEVEIAIHTITSHAASLGLGPVFTRGRASDDPPESPFLILPDRVLRYTQALAAGQTDEASDLLADAHQTIDRCLEDVEEVRATMGKRGSSLTLTNITFRLMRLLKRLRLLLQVIDRTPGCFRASAIRLFREVVTTEKTHMKILPLFRAHADLLAFQVVEHAARKGGKYITSSRRDYGKFFMASLLGGFIVAVFSFMKVLLGKLGAPLGIEALLFGLNYSACFVLIYLTGGALATKQPAMTANTIAQALGRRHDRHLEELEELVVRVWRSQFVSFAGNLLMALPMAFAISEIFYRLRGSTVADPEYATKMLENLHPWQSGTIIFAAIAGIFLFLAGLVSGWVDNRLLYAQIPTRVAKHRALVAIIGPKRAQTVADFLDKNMGVLIGNIFLGFALGSTGSFGEIFGLPLDIRHIAFASAEFGTALEIHHFQVTLALVLPVAIGVSLIGLVNFLVSFGLSLGTALESRQITWREIRVLIRHLGRSILRRPLDWVFPPKSVAELPDIKKATETENDTPPPQEDKD